MSDDNLPEVLPKNKRERYVRQRDRPIGAGSPTHVPTAELRTKVEAFASVGIPLRMIAKLIGLGSENTLIKHYDHELELGEAKGLAQVANTLFKRATSGNDLGAAIFYLKAKGGWSEKQTVVHEGGDRPITFNIITGFDSGGASDKGSGND